MTATDVVLVDAGGTNIGSVRYALERLGVEAQISNEPARIRRASHVILPGVGAAGPGMARLQQTDLVDLIRELEQPVLGVCLGMQLLFDHSEEGDTPCLGVIPGRVLRIEADARRRVPHMGWNELRRIREDPLLDEIPDQAFVYFVHSYAVPQAESTIASVDYGSPLSAIVRHRNFCGMQFHPERSGPVGALLLRNFLSS